MVFKMGTNARAHTTSIAIALKPVKNKIHLILGSPTPGARAAGAVIGVGAALRARAGGGGLARPPPPRHPGPPLTGATIPLPAAAIQSVRWNPNNSTSTTAVNSVPHIAPSTL